MPSSDGFFFSILQAHACFIVFGVQFTHHNDQFTHFADK
jgi:hypothetical protein